MSRAACLVSAKNWTKNFLFKFKAASTLYTGAIWERSFISTFRAAVNINSSRKQLFENTFQTEGIWRRQLFVFVWTQKTFWKRWCLMVFQGYDNQVTSQLNLVPRVSHLGTRLVTSLRELSPNTNKSKMTSDCCVFKFLQRSMDGKHLSRFSSETSVSKSFGVVKPMGLKCTSAFTPTLLLHYLATIS